MNKPLIPLEVVKDTLNHLENNDSVESAIHETLRALQYHCSVYEPRQVINAYEACSTPCARRIRNA